LKLILGKLNIPDNFEVNIICADFITMDINKKYDLIVGNPPFSRAKGKIKEEYLKYNENKDTNNLSVMFLEKCMRNSDCVSLVLNKTVLSNYEFKVTRDILRKSNIKSIIDFGRYGFTGVSIETINLIVSPNDKPQTTIVMSMKYNKKYEQVQSYITDSEFPSFIIYRNKEFDIVANKLEFGIFDVFRDRQITKSITKKEPSNETIWVIKAKNINDDGGTSYVQDYDQHIDLKKAKELCVYKYVGDTTVYLTPNMTYNPRVIENIPNTIADGSTAILIPKKPINLTNNQIKYFSSEEYRSFYKIARNLSTQSINVDKSSVYFYGRLKYDA
jgi:DNA (cytosine-5)-methyltransferase 1